MRASMTLIATAFLSACAAAPTASRAAPVPPLEIELPKAKVEPRVRADGDRSAPLPMDEVPERFGVDGGETRLRDRVIMQTVEVEVPVRRVEVEQSADYGYYEAPPRPAYSYGGQVRRSRFPVNAAIGAGVGAIIGNQRGRRGRGALIGGSIGLMFDLMRGWR